MGTDSWKGHVNGILYGIQFDRTLDDTVVALLVLGDRRPFLLRPRANRYAHEAPAKGATHDLAPDDRRVELRKHQDAHAPSREISR